MNNVGFFRSIHLKFVLVYVLLILIAMQIIGVYFVRQLEDTLVSNFKNALTERVNLLAYNIEGEISRERSNDDPTLEEEVRKLLVDFKAEDISETRVIDSSNRVVGTSDPSTQDLVGQRTNDVFVKRALVGKDYDKVVIDEESGQRIWVLSSPIHSSGEVVGVIYLEAKIETVFKQMGLVIRIFATGLFIALAITAVLGVLLARTITKPISDMRRHALALSKGNFSRKVKIYGNDEIGQLAYTFNVLTKRLQEAQTLKESERRKLSSVLSYMTDGVIATDRRGRVILINEPAMKMLQVTNDHALSCTIVDLLQLQDNYTFDDLLKEQDSVILDYSTAKTPYILRANFSTIQKDTGFANGLITVLHDITEQEKIDMERREFVANVSHELRTPLTTMRSYLEALADGAWKDEEIAPKFLHVTQNETERMIRLVNDLLKLSKLDSKDYTLTMDLVDFVALFNHIIDRFELTKKQTIHFVRQLPDTPIFVEVDKDKLTQVIDNIISNALKYSPEGGTVTFQLELYKNEIVVGISDQGVGIPKENLKKIFERFYRVDKARTRKLGGTGLGLAIAKEMITAHGGDIWAASEEGKGTTISFSLPYTRTQGDEWV